MTREERQARIEALERWVAEQHAEFEDDAFPEELRAQWDSNNAELDEHRRVMAELEARDARIRRLSDREPNREGGSDRGITRPSNGGAAGPQLVSRMSETDVYDLRSFRANPFNPEVSARELRDRAMRAVELTSFPALVDRSAAQAHVQYLLDHRDGEDERPIARRILLTGSPQYRRAFTKTLSAMLYNRPVVGLSEEEQRAMEQVRAMSVGTGSAGGFAVPYMLDPTVIPTSNLSVNPFRRICRTEQIVVNEWRGVTSAGVTAGYGTEPSEATDNAPVLAQPNLLMQRASCFVPVSIELTQDWGALQSELAQLIQDAKDDLEASKFTTGTGTNEPSGLLTGATSTTPAAGVASFAVGDLYNLETALPPRFRPRAQFIANRFTYNKVRQFDTAGGASLWTPLPAPLAQGLQNDVPVGGNTGHLLLGYGANEDSAMPSVLTTGSKILVLLDPRYYVIVDRIGMDIEVIPHLFGATNRYPTGQRGFYAFWRNNARLLDPNAARVLVTG